jgi:ABC-type lipoprotein release transport system permease subunit
MVGSLLSALRELPEPLVMLFAAVVIALVVVVLIAVADIINEFEG